MPKSQNPYLAHIFSLIILIAPFIIVPELSEFADLPQGAWLQISSFGFLVYLGLSFSINKSNCIKYQPILLPMVLFLFWSICSMTWAINPYEVIRRVNSYAAAAGALFIIINVYEDSNQEKKIMGIIFATGIGVALIGAGQHLFNVDLLPQIHPPSATFANKNLASQFIILTIPLGFYFFIINPKKNYCYLISFCLAIMCAFITYTQTRSSLLALGVEGMFFWSINNKYRHDNIFKSLDNIQKRALLAGVLLFLILINLSPNHNFDGTKQLRNRFNYSISQIQEPKTQPRFAYWLNSISMSKDFFWKGTGLGNFKSHYPLYHRAVLKDISYNEEFATNDIHNDYLQIFIELGIIGFGLAGWFVVQGICAAKKALVISETASLKAACLLTSLAGFAVIAFLSFPLECNIPPFLGAIYLGLLIVLGKTHQHITLSKSRTILFTIVSASILLFLSTYNIKAFSADAYLGQLHQPKDNLINAQKAVKTFPIRTQLYYFLGQAYDETNNHKMAAKSYSIMLKTHPNSVNTMVNLGASFLKEGSLNKAELITRKALTIYPEHWAAHNNLGTVMLRKNDYLEAKKEFTLASTYNPLNAQVWNNLAQTARLTNDPKTAETATKEAKKLTPD